MLTLSWRKAGASSALAMALVAGLPALAQAQLFPNLWIQRERTPCPNEPPFYAHVRHNYYGYFPTCWRKFPEGWACPCPNTEAPDAAASFRNQPRDPKPELPPPDSVDTGGPLQPTTPDLGPGPGAPRRGADGEMPPLPRGIGPLNDNPTAPGVRDVNPVVPGQPAPPRGRDPFDPIPPALPRSSGPGSSSMRSPAPAIEGPALEQPAGESTSIQPTSGNDALAGPGEPVLALPEMSRPDGSLPADPTMPASLAPDMTTVNSQPPANAAPAQAPRRPGLLSGLLNLGNWRRR
jgi:hypothetical protein